MQSIVRYTVWARGAVVHVATCINNNVKVAFHLSHVLSSVSDESLSLPEANRQALYQRRAKQGCLTTSYERSTRRWLVAFSMTKGAVASVARSESTQLHVRLQQKIVLLSESTLPKMAMLQRWRRSSQPTTSEKARFDRLRRSIPRRNQEASETGCRDWRGEKFASMQAWKEGDARRKLDRKVQNYVRALRSAGTPIGSSVVMAAGEGMMVRAHNSTEATSQLLSLTP